MSMEPLFVYGTLRVGEALSGLLPEAPYRYAATTKGALHYSPHTEGYPVLIPGNDDVQGDLLWVDFNSPDVAYVLIMELQAGYSAVWRDVFISGNDDAAVPALVFEWSGADGKGRRIDGDDWTERNRGGGMHACNLCGAKYPTLTGAVECEWSCEDMLKLEEGMNFAITNDSY